MRLRFSPVVFMAAYCLIYAAALMKDVPAFRYYPLYGQVIWGPGTVKGLGPAMAWYGIMAEATLIAAVLATLVPDRWLEKPLRNFIWAVPLALMVTCVFLMKKFFA